MRPNTCRKSVFRVLTVAALVLVLGCQRAGKGISKGKPTDSKRTIPKIVGTITGASMVPTLLGEHHKAKCSECGFRMSFEIMKRDSQFICSNCGESQRMAESEVETVLGNQRLFDKFNASRTVAQWDVIAFESTTEADKEHKVKRIVGLPGDTIELRSGDLYVNDSQVVKPVLLMEKMKILVHDSHFASESKPRWIQNEQQVAFPLPLEKNNTPLHYQHLGCYQNRRQNRKESIKDSYGFNQTLSRSLNTVGDFGVEITLSNVTDLQIDLQMRSKKYGLVQIELEQINNPKLDRYSVSQYLEGSGKTPCFSGFRSTSAKTHVLQFWQIDGTVRLMVDRTEFGKSVLHETPSTSGDTSANKNSNSVVDSSFEVNSTNQIVFSKLTAKSGQIERLRIFRDLYYYDRLPNQKHSLGDDEYFVLGDNVPISSDSRHFGSVKRNSIIGVLESKE